MITTRQVVLAGLVAGVALGFAGARAATDSAWVVFFDNMHWSASSLAAAFLVLQGIGKAPPTLAIPLRRMAAGFVCYAAGQWVWNLQTWLAWSVFPGPADALYLLLGPFMMAGLWYWGQAQLDTARRRTVLLDTATLLTAVLTVSLALHLPRTGPFSTWQILVLMAYPVFLMAPACLGVVLMLSLRIRPNLSNVLLLLSTTGYALIWTAWHMRFINAADQPGSWLNLSFSITILLMGGTAGTLQLDPMRTQRAERLYNGIQNTLPLMMVLLAATGVLLVQSDPHLDRTAYNVVVIGAVAIIMMAMARQSDVLNEHSRLLATERLLHERDAEVQRKQYQLQELTQHQQALLESAGDGILVWRNGAFVDCNSAAQRLFGCTRIDILGHTAWDFSPDFQPDGQRSDVKAQQKIDAALNGTAQAFEWRHRQRNGNEFDAEVTLSRLADDNTRFIAIVRDISERKQAEREIRDQKDLLQATLSASPGIFLVFDQHGHIKSWNQLFERMLEYSPDDIWNMHVLTLIAPEDQATMAASIEHMLTQGDIENLEVHMMSRSSKVIPVMASASRVMLGGVAHIVAFAMDLSIRKLMEKELQDFQVELIHRNNNLRLINLLSSRLHGLVDIDTIAAETVDILQMLGRTASTLLYLSYGENPHLTLAASTGLHDT